MIKLSDIVEPIAFNLKQDFNLQTGLQLNKIIDLTHIVSIGHYNISVFI